MSDKPRLTVKIQYDGFSEDLSGEFDDVARQAMKFLYDIAPKLSILDKLKLTVEDDELIEELGLVMKIAPEGPVFLKDFKGIKTSDAIISYLVGASLGFRLGILPKPALSIDQLSIYTGAGKEVVRARLSELNRSLMVETVDLGEKRITTSGLLRFKDHILPKLIEED